MVVHGPCSTNFLLRHEELRLRHVFVLGMSGPAERGRPLSELIALGADVDDGEVAARTRAGARSDRRDGRAARRRRRGRAAGTAARRRGPSVAGWLQARHTAQGVGFRCGGTVVAAGSAPDGGVRLELTDGSVVDADAVVVGVGVFRDVAWLASAGLETADGLVCDEHGRTSHPCVFGVGDVVCHRTATGTTPVAHWTATGNSARRAAHALLDHDVPHLPDDGYFWSDQFDMRLQCARRVAHDSEMTVVAGDLDGDSFVAQFHTDGRPNAVPAVSHPRQFLLHRRALQKEPAG